ACVAFVGPAFGLYEPKVPSASEQRESLKGKNVGFTPDGGDATVYRTTFDRFFQAYPISQCRFSPPKPVNRGWVVWSYACRNGLTFRFEQNEDNDDASILGTSIRRQGRELPYDKAVGVVRGL